MTQQPKPWETPWSVELTDDVDGGDVWGIESDYGGVLRMDGVTDEMKETGERIVLWKTALADIAPEQIERDKALYPHVREMADALKGWLENSEEAAGLFEERRPEEAWEWLAAIRVQTKFLLDKLGDDQ